MPPETTITKPDDRLLRYALAFGIVLALIGLYYFEEDWRGKHEWLKLRNQLEAQGAMIDWTNYVPSELPPEQNFFAAPKMQAWFSGRGANELTGRLSRARDNFLSHAESEIVARVSVVNPGTDIASETADIVLDYDSSLSAVTLPQENADNSPGPHPETIPLIVMDQVPLLDAIKNLAQRAGLKYVMDARTGLSALGPQPQLSCRWENLTAKEALKAVMSEHHLRFVPDSKTRVGHITAKSSGDPDLCSSESAAKELKSLLDRTVAATTNEFRENCVYSSAGLALTQTRVTPVQPVRVVVRANGIPSLHEIELFFPGLTNATMAWINSHAEAQADTSNTFSIRFSTPQYVTAKDYLKWSDEFVEDFASISQALQRPFARIDGDYQNPSTIPIPNFACLRWMAQTLTDRAKCHLLLGQSAAALQDLALVRDLCRMLEGRPQVKPTLIATMINSTITSLYVQSIAEGIRLHAWREPELAALQAQLKQIDLPPLLARSFEFERASSCRLLETVTPDQFISSLSKTGWTSTPKTNLWEKLKNPTYLMFKTGPRGWVYQNMSKIARLEGKLLDGVDVKQRQVSPQKTESATKEMLADMNHFSPYNYLANEVVANFTRAVQNLSRNQTLVDEGLIACGLERHRLANGQYPTRLASLSPSLLEKVPNDLITGQPLKYKLKEDGQFLLYSVGWNETDDGGIPGPLKESMTDLQKGDWVWAIW